MPKPKPYTLPRLEEITETRTFTDPAQPGVEITLTLSVPPDYGISLAVMEKGGKYAEQYVNGTADGPPAPLPPVGGKPLVLSESLCSIVAFLEQVEVTDDPENDPKYDFYDWVSLSATMPTAFDEIAEWANSLRVQASKNAKNSPGASTEP
jgi:hypothetical protein